MILPCLLYTLLHRNGMQFLAFFELSQFEFVEKLTGGSRCPAELASDTILTDPKLHVERKVFTQAAKQAHARFLSQVSESYCP